MLCSDVQACDQDRIRVVFDVCPVISPVNVSSGGVVARVFQWLLSAAPAEICLQSCNRSFTVGIVLGNSNTLIYTMPWYRHHMFSILLIYHSH
ncbi:hypothetical protein BaRGS_00012139 [Batillaria attramentaria]|uniref:Uncharacterized protein n=1 Tax=Batillaria attramentaria TaxID=370345 RepID=A0ABD0LAD5_9CAEN